MVGHDCCEFILNPMWVRDMEISVCVCVSVHVCFTCYFSMILMTLQSARHFNRARERLVKHTHTHTLTTRQRREAGTLEHGGLEGDSVQVCVFVCVCISRVSQGDGDT